VSFRKVWTAVITELRQGGNMRQRQKRIMIAKKKASGRKGSERQKLTEKHDQKFKRLFSKDKEGKGVD
jgi:hypothetical protein